MNQQYQMTRAPQSPETATGRAREVLDNAQRQVGFIPNMYANMVHSPGLLDAYLHGYDLFRNESGFSAPEQEVVFLSVSVENGCTYCVAAHSALADMQSKVPPEVTAAIRDGTTIPDPKLRALSEFTRRMVATRGWPGTSAVDAFLSAGYTERHILEIILAIAVKTLSNYSNHIFQTQVDDMFAGRRWQDPRR